MCANDEEECVGGCGGIATARELVVDEGEKMEIEEKEKGDEVGGPKSCCSSKRKPAAVNDADEIVELPSIDVSAANQPTTSPSCCAPAPSARPSRPPTSSCGGCCSRTTGGGCCTGTLEGSKDADEDEKDRVAGRPLRIRTGGLGVVVCGPGHMVVRPSPFLSLFPCG
jgi:hypothetical protein